MTTIREHLDASVRRARAIKEEEAARARRRDSTDIRPLVEGWRGDEPVVVLVPQDVDRDQALQAARIEATAFGCDAIAFTTEGWAATGEYVDRNPVTGKPWGPGEMQRAVEQHGAREKGWIREGLSTFVVNRAGDMVGRMSFYRVVERDPRAYRPWAVEWDTEPEEAGRTIDSREEGNRATGLVPETLVSYMNETTLDVFVAKVEALLGREGFGLTPTQARAYLDAATIKSLPSLGWTGAAMLMSDDKERAAVLSESLSGYGGTWWRGADRG